MWEDIKWILAIIGIIGFMAVVALWQFFAGGPGSYY